MLDTQVEVPGKQLVSPQDFRGKAQTGSKNAELIRVQTVLKAVGVGEINKEVRVDRGKRPNTGLSNISIRGGEGTNK